MNLGTLDAFCDMRSCGQNERCPHYLYEHHYWSVYFVQIQKCQYDQRALGKAEREHADRHGQSERRTL